MLKVTVKTLDSQNHTFSVNDDILVKDFKNEINTKLAIPVELQKLIFCGRVLQDEKRLSEYEVNEKVVHLVKKQPQPPGSSAPPPEPNANNAGNNNARRPGQRDSTFTIQGPGSLTGLVHSLLGHIDDAMRTATTNPAGQNRESGEAGERHLNIHINLNENEPRDGVDTRLNSIRRLLGYIGASLNELDRIPNSSMAANVIVGTGGNVNVGPTNAGAASSTAPTGPNIGSAPQVTVQTGTVSGNGSLNSLLENIILNSTSAIARSFNIDGSVEIQSSGVPSTASSTTSNTATAQLAPPDDSASSSTPTSTTNTASNQTPAGYANARPERNLFELMRTSMEETQRTQERLNRHLVRMTNAMQSASQASQEDLTTLQSDHRLISRAMHHIAHVYHLLSDLQVNFVQRERNQIGLFTQTGNPRMSSSRNTRRSIPQMRSMSETRRPREQAQRTSSTAASPSGTIGSAAAFASTTNLTNWDHAASNPSTTASGLGTSLRGGLAGSLYLSQAPIVVMTRPNSNLSGALNLLTSTAQQATRTTPNNLTTSSNITTNISSGQNALNFQPINISNVQQQPNVVSNSPTNSQQQPNVAPQPPTNTQQHPTPISAQQPSQQQAPNGSRTAHASAPFSFVSLESAHTSPTSIGHILDPFWAGCNSVFCHPEIREVFDISLIAVPDFGFGAARPTQPARQSNQANLSSGPNSRPTDVNFIRDLYSIVLQHIPQNELISLLISRDFTPLNRVRDHLQHYVRDVMFEGQQPNLEQIDLRVRSMAESLQTQVNHVFSSSSDQQVGGQLISFINTNLNRLIQLLLSPPQGDMFAPRIQQFCTAVWNEYMQQIWPLLTTRLHLLTRTLELVTSSLHDPFLNSVMGMLSRGIMAQTSQTARTYAAPAAQSSETSATDSESLNRDNQMEVDPEPLPQPPLSNFAAFANGLTANIQSILPSSVFFQSFTTPTTSAATATAAPLPANANEQSSNSSLTHNAPSPRCPSNDWRFNVPSSWLPIMQTDARLLEQTVSPSSSRELSAAYRSGMNGGSHSPSLDNI